MRQAFVSCYTTIFTGLTYNPTQFNIFVKPSAQYVSHFGKYKRPNGRERWPVVSSPQNVRHFLCKHQEEWLPREQSEVSRPSVPPSNKKLGELETGLWGLKKVPYSIVKVLGNSGACYDYELA